MACCPKSVFLEPRISSGAKSALQTSKKLTQQANNSAKKQKNSPKTGKSHPTSKQLTIFWKGHLLQDGEFFACTVRFLLLEGDFFQEEAVISHLWKSWVPEKRFSVDRPTEQHKGSGPGARPRPGSAALEDEEGVALEDSLGLEGAANSSFLSPGGCKRV